MTRQARIIVDIDNTEHVGQWHDCGDVTHVEAAANVYADRTEPAKVQTRCMTNPDIVFDHTVSQSVSIKVVPHRKD